MKRSINDWVSACHELAVSKGWWEGVGGICGIAHDANELLAKLMLVTTEIAEAAEEVRMPYFDPKETVRYSSEGKPEGFPIELADAVIRIFDLCGRLGIDLEGAIATKHAYNATRSFKHGKRA